MIKPKPFICGSQEAWKVSLDILHVIQLWCQRIVDINGNDFPVRLFLVQKSHDSQDLDLLDLAWVSDRFANFADIERIIVTFCLRFGMNDVGIFPSLREGTIVENVT